MIFLGIDLHSDCFTCCFIFHDGTKKLQSFNFSQESLKQFYSILNLETYVILEASTNSFKFVETIREKVKEVFVANTHKLKLISMVKKKTDKIDSEKLAIFLKMQIISGEKLIEPVFIPDEIIQQLRSLFTTYNLLKKQIGQIKNRIHAIYKQNLHPFTKEYIFGKKNIQKLKELKINDAVDVQLKILFEQIVFTEKQQNEVEKSIKVIGAKYYKQIDILTSMRGISILTAIAIISDIAKIDRFPNSKHFTSYLRSAPGVDSSNNETHVTKTTKFGRKLSIVLISQSLNHFRDSNEKLEKWVTKKVDLQGQKRGKIRMGLCRRVFAEIFQMLKKEEYHYWRDENNHLKKMKEYDNFLINYGIPLKSA